MKGTVFLATLALVLVVGLAAFVRSREAPPAPPVQLVVTNSAAPAHLNRHTPRAAETTGFIAPQSSTNKLAATNLYTRFRSGDIPRVSREQLEPYLAKHHRSVEALLGALRASGDDALLKEAKERFPKGPRVQFAAAFKSDTPEERQAWLEKFKQSEPGNSLPNYLLAHEHFQADRLEPALQELAAAGGKAGFDNHLLDFIQNAEEAYHAAGYSDAEAKAIAFSTALLPELVNLKQDSLSLVDLAKRYDAAGDTASAQALREMALALGRRLEAPAQTTIIQELVGTAIERIVLNSMGLETAYGAADENAKALFDAAMERRKAIRALTAEAEPILSSMSDQDLTHFYDRLKMYGESATLRWVVGQSAAR